MWAVADKSNNCVYNYTSSTVRMNWLGHLVRMAMVNVSFTIQQGLHLIAMIVSMLSNLPTTGCKSLPLMAIICFGLEVRTLKMGN